MCVERVMEKSIKELEKATLLTGEAAVKKTLTHLEFTQHTMKIIKLTVNGTYF